MPRKLCWIEVDEEGRWPLDPRAYFPSDATEEVVEAVAKQIVQTADECNICVHRHEADDYARSLLIRLASTPPNKETT